jgi:dihydropyrimidinase
MIDLVVANGTVVTPSGVEKADVVVAGERIVGLGTGAERAQASRVIDAEGRIVLPGGVDVHTHFLIGFMGQRSVYDFEKGTQAALRGGTTTSVDFALHRRGRGLLDGVKHRRVQADRHVATDYGLHLIVTDVNAATLAELPRVLDAGVTTIKCYMVYESEQLKVDDGALLDLMGAAGPLGMMVGLHAENAGIIDRRIAAAVRAGEIAPRFHALTRPPVAEAEAVARALVLAEDAGCASYIFHLSVGRGVDLIARARRRGVRAFGETCSHYLALDKRAYERADAHLYVMSPPLRTPADQEALWAGLRSGTLATVASDDASYSAEMKASGAPSFHTIPNGVPGAEHRLPVLYTLGVAQGRLSLPELAEIFSTRPARLFGMAPQKGAIVAGADADLVVIDPDATKPIVAGDHFGPIGYSPYDGMQLSGWPVLTVRRGVVCADAGRVSASAGDGRFLHRSLPDTSITPGA